MEREVICELEAIRRCRLCRPPAGGAAARTYDLLPFYGDVLPGRHSVPGRPAERICNDVVHVALNQLRRVCNALIRRFGKPERICIETMENPAPSGEAGQAWREGRIARSRQNAMRARQFDRLRQRYPNIADSRHNRLKFMLWHELDPRNPARRRCIYTGQVISAAKLFSPAVEIDHIRPRSLCHESGRKNLTVCFARANRLKGARAPRAFAEWADRLETIRERASVLPEAKASWFDAAGPWPDAAGEEFPARQLADARRLAKCARAYLACLYRGCGTAMQRGPAGRIAGVPGRATARTRREWGLDDILADGAKRARAEDKNRADHRQHAIDAIIIGVISGPLAGKWPLPGQFAASRLAGLTLPVPWPDFVDETKKAAFRIVVSHKPDHGKGHGANEPGKCTSFGRLHNDSAYGLTGEVGSNGKPVIVRRKALTDLRASDLKKIRDGFLRDRLGAYMKDNAVRSFPAGLTAFSREDALFRGIRRVRLVEAAEVIVIGDRRNRPFKAYKANSNFSYDVWQLSCGKWVSEVVTTYDAHRPGWVSAVRSVHHNPKKVMSLKQQDMIAVDAADETRRILRVVKFSRDGRICLVPHFAAGDLKSPDADASDPFRYIVKAASSLKAAGARQIRIDEIGIVSDPGPLCPR